MRKQDVKPGMYVVANTRDANAQVYRVESLQGHQAKLTYFAGDTLCESAADVSILEKTTARPETTIAYVAHDMFGMSKRDLDEDIADSIYMTTGQPEMLVMAMLSDAQQMLEEWGEDPKAREAQRQLLNRAKYVLSKMSKRD